MRLSSELDWFNFFLAVAAVICALAALDVYAKYRYKYPENWRKRGRPYDPRRRDARLK